MVMGIINIKTVIVKKIIIINCSGIRVHSQLKGHPKPSHALPRVEGYVNLLQPFSICFLNLLPLLSTYHGDTRV